MTPGWWWRDLAAWSLQIAVLTGAGAAAARLFRVRGPGVRQLYWQGLLAMCLLAPAVEPWQRQDTQVTIASGEWDTRPGGPSIPVSRGFRFGEAALALAAAGACLRGLWLAAGLQRLRRYRRESREVTPLPAAVASAGAHLGVKAEFRVCQRVPGPVTFGLRRPVVLLPERFLDLAPLHQEAVACHELVHVARRDWMYTVAEEAVRAVLWFHPAVWWLLAQIQLAREQAVDHAVIGWTQAREQYVEALLAVAGSRVEVNLAPAPLFLRKRHLRARVVSLFQEGSMSKKRTIGALAASFALLAAAAWVAAGTFPLEAAPQAAADAAGVSVDAGQGLLHRAPVAYPREALDKRIQGDVLLEVEVSEKGTVTDARVLSGPEELRAAALRSVLQWHYARSPALPARVPATIHFQLPTQGPGTSGAPAALTPHVPPGPVKQISIEGLPPAARDELAARLPVRLGDTLTADNLLATMRAARDFDEHLTVVAMAAGEGAQLRIALAGGQRGADGNELRVRVGGNMQQNKLVYQPVPVYPPQAKRERVQGTVRLEAAIGADGRVENLKVLSGDPLLAPAALDAVKQWEYQPTLLNGEPVAVITRVDVNFTLRQ